MSDSMTPEVRSKLAQVKLLALDVDGVLTDGGLYYTESGEELKKFNVKDGLGLKLLMQAGIEVAIITTSTTPVTHHRAQKLGIQHVYLGAEDKLTVLIELCDRLGISLAEVAFVGDDIVDLPILKEIGCPITVADGMAQNKRHAILITKLGGGQGCVREVCELLLSVRQNLQP